jgi:hypothetical protein
MQYRLNDRARPRRERTRFASGYSANVALIVALAFPGSAFADYCQMYSGVNQTGSSYKVNLPGVEGTYSPVWWGTSSRRAIGEELNYSGSPVYKNMESVRIRAMDTGVRFYAYTGDNMDGVFQVVGCSKGHTCTWTFGSMKNRARSFNCQRDLDSWVVIPTVDIADTITQELDAEIPKSSKIDNSTIKYGRLGWTNYRSRCERLGIGCGGTWQDKYRDTLEFTAKLGLDPHPAWWYKQYDAWITFWLRPELFGGQKEFRIEETWYRIKVESGAISQLIADGLEAGIQPLFDGNEDLGDAITDRIWDEVIAQAGDLADWAMRNNLRIYPDYGCSSADFDDNALRWPGVAYSSYLQDYPCGYGMTWNDYPPVLNLIKSL